jgi:hypothetical protein
MVIRYNGIEIDREAMTIRHRGHLYEATERRADGRGGRRGQHVQFPAFQHLILGGGLSVWQLFDMVYGDLKSGGPDDGPHIFWVAFVAWNPVYRSLGLVMHHESRGGLKRYQLIPEPCHD